MAPANDVPLPLQIQITATEERSSMLKSWSVYLLEVNDFGRKKVLEKRFDDFDKLHCDLKEIEPGMPPLPEKKFMASTDASVVAERKPAFEKILRYLLRSDAAVHEKSQTLFKFLDLPTAAIVAFRYLFKAQRISSARQCGKLTDPKLEKEAFRLSHPAMVKTGLRLLEEGALRDPEQEAKAESAAAFAAALAEAEVAVVETLRFALASGSEPTRQFFLQEKGLGVLLRYIFRKGKKEPGTGPDQRARGVLNALIKVEADHFPAVMADFLEKGGIADFQEGLDLLQSSGFADFISKLLWIAWDIQVQQVFFAEAHRPEALGLLSKLFVCPSRGARVCAGLLLANALCHAQLGSDREAQAAQGLRQLTEEMASCGESQDTEDQEVRTFVQGLGQSAERFARILTCAQAPWQQHNGQLPHEEHPLWPGATFSLWCLLRMRPDPSRLGDLRPALPAVAQGGPPRARWLAGELLLQLQLQVPGQLPSLNSPEAIVETNIQERRALEFALHEMFENTRSGLHAQLSESSQVIETQQRLIEERQKPLRIAAGGNSSDGWHQPLEAALAKLKRTREELSTLLTDAEQQRQSAERAVREVLEMDTSDLSQAEDQAMDQQLQSMRQTEVEYLARCHEQEEQSSALRAQEEQVATANAAMENAEKVLQEMRSKISSYEADISNRQKEVQNKRTMASSDMQAARNQLSVELENIKQMQTKLRERAVAVQAELQKADGSPEAAKEMEKLKADAGRLKSRAAELTQELQAASVDPQQLEQQAVAAEHAVQHLGEQRDQLRGELQGLEAEHLQARATWQQAVSSLQHARQEKEVADLQSSSLRRQLEGQWTSWHPLWSKRLQAWRARSQALGKAARSAELLGNAAQQAWDGLRREAELRHEALTAVEALQQDLAALAHDLSSIEDAILHH